MSTAHARCAQMSDMAQATASATRGQKESDRSNATRSGKKACPVCGKIFGPKYLRRHLAIIHAVGKFLKCPNCGLRCDCPSKLIKHARIRHPKSALARGKINVSSIRVRHGKAAGKSEADGPAKFVPHVCPVPGCGERFRVLKRLREHQRLKHERRVCVKCVDCGLSFESAREMEEHRKAVHCDVKPVKGGLAGDVGAKKSVDDLCLSFSDSLYCEVCKTSFVRRHHVDRHVLTRKHMKNVTAMREQQQQQQQQQQPSDVDTDDSSDKESVESDLLSFRCELCTTTFVSKSNLIRHRGTNVHTKRVAEQTSIKSSHRNNTLLTARRLKNDQAVSSRSYGSKKHVCSTCGRAFKSMSGCATHALWAHRGGLAMKHAHKGSQEMKGSHHNHATRSTTQNPSESSTKKAVLRESLSTAQKLKNDQVPHSEKRIGLERRGHTCLMCRKVFKTYQAYLSHEQWAHTLEETFKCEHCTSMFKTANQLQRHIEKIHKIDTKEAVKQCDTLTLVGDEGIEPVKTLDQPDFVQSCVLCEDNFHDASDLKRHIESVHKQDKLNLCCDCGKAFLTHKDLEMHEKTVHGKLKPHVCPYCDKCFMTKSGMMRHVRSWHSESKMNVMQPKMLSGVGAKVDGDMECHESPDGECSEYPSQDLFPSVIITPRSSDYSTHDTAPALSSLNGSSSKDTSCYCMKCFLPFESKLALQQHIRMCHPRVKKQMKPKSFNNEYQLDDEVPEDTSDDYCHDWVDEYNIGRVHVEAPSTLTFSSPSEDDSEDHVTSNNLVEILEGMSSYTCRRSRLVDDIASKLAKKFDS